MHKDSAQLERRKLFLERNGYRILTAGRDPDGVAFVGSSHVDAIVLGGTGDFAIAKQIKLINSRVPIVGVVTNLDLPHVALDSIDALVSDFDGDQFLLDTLHFLLKVKPGRIDQGARGQKRGDEFAKRTTAAWRSRVAPE